MVVNSALVLSKNLRIFTKLILRRP